jgi:hypothetical protein
MTRLRRRRHLVVLAAYLATGSFLLQLGPCISMALNAGVSAFDTSTLLDENDLFLGTFAPCGTPAWMIVDENGNPTSEIFAWEDDLLFDCPVYAFVEPGDGQ